MLIYLCDIMFCVTSEFVRYTAYVYCYELV